MKWNAWHIFIADRDLTDHFLVNRIHPILQEFSSLRIEGSWFFIRYWENGPHIRLRVRDLPEDEFEALGDSLHKAAIHTTDGYRLEQTGYDASMKFDGWHSSPSSLPWFDQGAVENIMYEPEYRRYGGVHGLAVCETLFHHSSVSALQAVKSSLKKPDVRETLGIYYTARMISRLCNSHDELTDFLKRMAAGWKSFAPDPEAMEEATRHRYTSARQVIAQISQLIEAQIAGAAEWPAFLETYDKRAQMCLLELDALTDQSKLVSPLTGVAVRDDAEKNAAIKHIGMSLVHMMNNRLGLTPLHEYQFATMLLWANES